MQGDALSSAAFCAAIHDAVKELNDYLTPHDWTAKFDMDDGYALGPPQHVFRGVTNFATAIAALGLELRFDKCKCYSSMATSRTPHTGL